MTEEVLNVYNQEYESSTNSTSEKVYDEEINDYYFESDNFALKENPDYCSLLKTLAVLESQRARAIQDLDRLVEARQSALADPVGFVEKLQKNVDLNLPKLQRISELPSIDWAKYTTKFNLLPHRHMTRNKKVTATPPDPNFGNSSSFDNSSPSFSSSNSRNSETECFNQIPVVRGRVFSSDKPQTFNKLWSPEEQIRLQKLLAEFPEEEIEARRYEKISNALGNRTPQQVASRVQKYFIKLAKHGLPVPGRIPNVNSYTKRNGPYRKNRLIFNRSTFFASHEPPVYMSEFDDDCSMSWSTGNTDEDTQWNIDNDADSMNGFHQRELYTTQDFKDYIYRKNQTNNQSGRTSSQFRSDDINYKCIVCNCDPIVGNRWHCIDCPPATNLNFCNKCYMSDYESSTHRSNHRLESINFDDPDNQMDDDYTCTSFGDGYYNYLDPNYVSKK